MPDITSIIIEDENPAQEVLKSFINKIDWLVLSGVFDDAVSALEHLKNHEVDLIFLDIQIPTLTGIDFLKILKNPPQIIITSAYSQYALEAFELDVRDYLMKPFSFERFVKAVNKIGAKPDPKQIYQMSSPTVVHDKSFAFFNMNKTMVKVFFNDILYVESMREYIYIHTPSDKVVTKMGIGEMEKLLGNHFLRIHRSFLVNPEKITAYNAEEIFISKKELPIGPNYKKIVEAFLSNQITNVG